MSQVIIPDDCDVGTVLEGPGGYKFRVVGPDKLELFEAPPAGAAGSAHDDANAAAEADVGGGRMSTSSNGTHRGHHTHPSQDMSIQSGDRMETEEH